MRPEVARLRHANRLGRCLFIGVDRKLRVGGPNDAKDPKLTLRCLTLLPQALDRKLAKIAGVLSFDTI